MIRAGDAIVVALGAMIVGAVFALTWRPAAPAEWAEVRLPGAEPRRVALDDGRRVAVGGRLGDSVLQVSNGRIRFLSSPCRGKQCIHAGWLDTAGDFAACLPNGVSVTLVERNERFDALAY